MKKLISIVILTAIMLIFAFPMHASSYSRISENNPFGLVTVWQPDSNNIYMYQTDSSSWRNIYYPKVDKLVDLGISINRANLHYYRGSNQYICIGPNFEQYFHELDSFIVFNQEKGMKNLILVYPKNQLSYPGFEDDTVAYYWWWRIVVERYDGDGEGILLPNDTTLPLSWRNQYVEEFVHLKEPIKYWEITNEPYCLVISWPRYNHGTIEDFQCYVRSASRGIHDSDTGAKVIGPCAGMLGDWQDSLYMIWENNWSYGNDTMSADSFWSRMSNDNTMEYFDIYSYHVYGWGTGIIHHIDSMVNSLDNLGVSLKPIWLTETGCRWTWDIPAGRATEYKRLLAKMLYHEYLDKTFYFCLRWYNRPNNSFGDDSLFSIIRHDTEWTNFPAAESLYAFISRNIPYIRLVNPDSGSIIYNNGNYSITFDSVSDYWDDTLLGVHETNPTTIKVRIEYSIDSGFTWIEIADSVEVSEEGDGSYNWSVPNITSECCKLRVIAIDPHELEGTSTSDNYFSIRSCYWPKWSDTHPFEWDDEWHSDSFDECDYIIETSSGNYLASVKIDWLDTKKSGLILCDPDSSPEFSLVKEFTSNQFAWIRCINEMNDPEIGVFYILSGYYFGLFNDEIGSIKLLDSSFDILDAEVVGDCVMRTIDDLSGNGYISVGWNDGKMWIGRFTINPSSKVPSIAWDNEFSEEFNNLEIPGHLYSIIKTSNEEYIAVGHNWNYSNGGACYYRISAEGEIIDSHIYDSTMTTGWTAAYDVVENVDDSFYVMVGTHESLGGFVRAFDEEDDSLWSTFFYTSQNPFIINFWSVILNDDNHIIVAGNGMDSLLGKKVGLILELNYLNGNIQSVTAPLSGLYNGNMNMSQLRPLCKTSDGGYITGCYICNNSTSPWIKYAGIAKFGYVDQGNQERLNTNVSPGTNIMNFNVMLANSMSQDQSTIRFVLPRDCHVNICVYNILGQKVKTLINDNRSAGAYELFWDGTDHHGVQVSSGSYFLRFNAGDFQTTKSLTVIR